ncbi:MAG TPA: NADH-quinone oxidoreductase subunit C [Gaiellaceae bacterium]|nr:NADH-quinone oxidoreductase subunit C [Gaiellaceae bacterium]
MSARPERAQHDALTSVLGGLAAEEPGAPEGERRFVLEAQGLARAAAALGAAGGHFAGLFGCGPEPSAVVAVVAFRGELVELRGRLDGERAYPSLAAATPAALLPERELHDTTGLVPLGHPELEPLLRPDADRPQRRVAGPQTFLIPYGPIRSGVVEAMQFPIETGGEDVLAFGVRPFFKHRGLERRFAGMSLDHGAYLAERVAGPEAVAHARACARAAERAAGATVPPRAERWRLVHAELERIAAHLDTGAKLAEDAALSVGAARLGALKEEVMRLRARLCGNRFGRGVVVPGGIRNEPLLVPAEVAAALDALEADLRRDRRLLLGTASFVDRLVGSGTLAAETVTRFGGVGPVARACSLGIDARLERPYGSYPRLGFRIARATAGDAMARWEVRLQEIDQSLHLIRQALESLDRLPPELRVPVAGSGEAYGWVEAPSGELVYRLRIEGSTVAEARIVPPALRNWPLLSESFRGDVLTDVAFVEHSFNLSPAGSDR